MTIYSLYIKTHSVTGLKYLGQTTKDPHKYPGSGRYWVRHLNKHGNTHLTEVIGVYDNEEDLTRAGKEYSEKFNVVKSKKWANLIPETGKGAVHYGNKFFLGKTFTEESRKKISDALKGHKKTAEHRAKLAETSKGNKNCIGRVYSKEARKNMSNAFKGRKRIKGPDGKYHWQ